GGAVIADGNNLRVACQATVIAGADDIDAADRRRACGDRENRIRGKRDVLRTAAIDRAGQIASDSRIFLAILSRQDWSERALRNSEIDGAVGVDFDIAAAAQRAIDGRRQHAAVDGCSAGVRADAVEDQISRAIERDRAGAALTDGAKRELAGSVRVEQ